MDALELSVLSLGRLGLLPWGCLQRLLPWLPAPHGPCPISICLPPSSPEAPFSRPLRSLYGQASLTQTYTQRHAHTDIRAHTRTHTCSHRHTYARAYMCAHKDTYIHRHAHIYRCVCTCTHRYMHIYIYPHTNMHTHRHTYTRVHTQRDICTHKHTQAAPTLPLSHCAGALTPPCVP